MTDVQGRPAVAAGRAPSPREVIAQARAAGVKMVDLRFVDLLGGWQHFTIPIQKADDALFSEGIGFDGSSIRGFQSIDESDLLLIPDPATATLDPALKIPTLAITGSVHEPAFRRPYSRDPRHVAQKAERYLQETGIATTSYFGPEAEFYVFNAIRFEQTSHSGFYQVDSDEGIWNSGAEGRNLGHRPRYQEGYFPVPPTDKLQDLRSQIALNLLAAGIDVEAHHHEVATAGQCEINMRFGSLTTMADQLMLYKYIVKNTCHEAGLTATFMPKPLHGDNGSGMHVHQSLWKDGQPLFHDPDGYGGLSELARHYVGGLLKHTPALLAFCAPTTNSYRRLVPGYEAPVNLIYSQRNRSACVRIPMGSDNPRAKRIEYRAPDPSANPYLAFAALLLAGIDGIKHGIEPPPPVDEDVYRLAPREAAAIGTLPGSLDAALNALVDDHDFLLAGGVFTSDLLEEWIRLKRAREVLPLAQRPHPYEFHLYHDV